MSHFTVLVIGKDPETQLAPFNEQDDEYSVFIDETDKVNAEFDDKHKLKYKTIENFAEEWFGYKLVDGAFGHTANPNAQWDWYQLGGRWTGSLKVKRNSFAMSSMEPTTGLTFGELGVLHQIYKHNPKKFAVVVKKYKGKTDVITNFIVEVYGTLLTSTLANHKIGSEGVFGTQAKQGFADSCLKGDVDWEAEEMKDFSTFAVLLNGEWIERGTMGWWGIVSDEKNTDTWDAEFKAILAKVPDNEIISVFDCHI